MFPSRSRKPNSLDTIFFFLHLTRMCVTRAFVGFSAFDAFAPADFLCPPASHPVLSAFPRWSPRMLKSRQQFFSSSPKCECFSLHNGSHSPHGECPSPHITPRSRVLPEPCRSWASFPTFLKHAPANFNPPHRNEGTLPASHERRTASHEVRPASQKVLPQIFPLLPRIPAWLPQNPVPSPQCTIFSRRACYAISALQHPAPVLVDALAQLFWVKDRCGAFNRINRTTQER
jgi:hypothetical protein